MTSPAQPVPYATPIHYEPIFVARQPIFTRQEQIWAYELLFRHSAQAADARITDQEVATSKVIVDGFAIASCGIGNDKKLLINFPQVLLTKGAPLALPPGGCIIEILESVRPTPEIIAACRKYKEAGYQLAIDDFVGQPGYEPLLALTDIVKVDVAALPPPSIIKLAQHLARYDCSLLAEKVETRQIYALTRSLGFQLFQGYYFSRPEMVSGRKISMENIARIRLLQELAKEDYELGDLTRIISADISLSYRLLTYINSAAFALRQKVGSVAQALAVLGGDPLRQWLTAIILSDIESSPRAEEIVFTSIRRGRFLENLEPRLNAAPYRRETLFLLGLFSKLDALLGMSMQEVLKNMPLHDELNVALCGQQNRPYLWLALARTIDRGDWQQVAGLLSRFLLCAEEVSSCHQEATVWTRNLLKYSAQ